MNVREITRCRSCQSDNLTTVLDLGSLAISDFLDPGQEPEHAPLDLVRCASCALVQLRHTVDRERLYRTYHYRSGVNETMVAELAAVVADATKRVVLEPGDAVLDIGCNDGTLLGFYPKDVRRIGFDPSDVATEAWVKRDFEYDLVRSFFPYERQHVPVPCKIVTAIACVYDVDDPNTFLDEVKRWLHPDGVLVLQFQDLGSMLRANAVDNICHEHLTYWSEASLASLLERHGLGIVACSYREINGGSIRLTLSRHGSKLLQMVVHDLDGFVDRVKRTCAETYALLATIRRSERLVYGLAASTKFNTLSQYIGIDSNLIHAIADRSPAKWGKRTVTGIPIVSEEEMRAANPDYLFCCAWQFADAFRERERDLLAQGARLIVPLPDLRIVDEARRRQVAHVHA